MSAAAFPFVEDTPEFRRAGAILTIDLDALTANWRVFAQNVKGEAAAVVKASAYGLGVERAAPALLAAGCKIFFVATIDEGIMLRNILGPTPAIHIFNGLMAGTQHDFAHHGLTPVLNTLSEVELWRTFCAAHDVPLPCNLHIDTAMSRLGLDEGELRILGERPETLMELKLDFVLSHLASAEDPENPTNVRQLERFRTALTLTPGARASLANSSGTFLGPEYHFDLVRPGAALYGVNPTPSRPNPMAQVVRAQGKILQVRTIDTPRGVGYGSTYEATAGAKIATVCVGYADGYHRCLSNVGYVYVGEHEVPVVGRVSMDLITIDVTQVSDTHAHSGALVDLIGPHNPVDRLAAQAGTIGYEILTSLGPRYHRVYVGEGR